MTIYPDQFHSKFQFKHRKLIIIAVLALALMIIIGVTTITIINAHFACRMNEYHYTSPLIRLTSNGPIHGVEQISSLGQIYYSFRGIPFAAPPITGIDPFTGKPVDRRFKATEPLEYTWTEPLKTYNFSKMCIQQLKATSLDVESSEDCLYLNIYVPAGGARKKTVMVAIHGGGFLEGSGRNDLYGPDFLLSEDNVVVVIQYRLGMFGFLNLGFEPYTGNMGLKDQQEALKWIHTNIDNFSGRNDQILLFGQSAGGVSAHFHLLNVESRKYFNRIFSSSGAALNPFFIRKNNQLRKIQKCFQTNGSVELIKYLNVINVVKLAACFASNRPYVFLPTIESSSVVGAFLTKTPEELYNSNEAPAMDAMFSLTTQEALGIHPSFYNLPYPKTIFNVIPAEANLPEAGEGNLRKVLIQEYKMELALVIKAYFSNVTSNYRDAFKQKRLLLLSDFLMGHSIVKSIVRQTQANYIDATTMGEPKKTFLFRFDVHTALNIRAATWGMNYAGATHGDDVCFMFHCHFLDQMEMYEGALKYKDANYDIIMRSVKMITNFARTGDPSIDANTHFVPSNPHQIFHGEVSNATKTRVKTDIKEQTHYDTWTQVKTTFNVISALSAYK